MFVFFNILNCRTTRRDSRGSGGFARERGKGFARERGLLEKQLDLERVNKQLDEVNAFIAAITAHKATL